MKTLIIIGREPIITYRITQLIGERAERKRVRQERIDSIKRPIKTIRRILGL